MREPDRTKLRNTMTYRLWMLNQSFRILLYSVFAFAFDRNEAIRNNIAREVSEIEGCPENLFFKKDEEVFNLETRKKLKKLDDKLGFFGNFDCFATTICRVDSTMHCPSCKFYLPDPTLGELIEVIDKKCDEKWDIERQKENGSWLVRFRQKKYSPTGNSYILLPSNSLEQALATALIWLYEKEE